MVKILEDIKKIEKQSEITVEKARRKMEEKIKNRQMELLAELDEFQKSLVRKKEDVLKKNKAELKKINDAILEKYAERRKELVSKAGKNMPKAVKFVVTSIKESA